MPASRALHLAASAAVALVAFPAAAAAYNTYWGDLHGHTMDSPVTLTSTTIDDYIRYARDTKSLNFVALTEKDFDLSDSEWTLSRSRAAAFTTSSFIAFSAFEWGDDGYGDFGHRPVYYVTDDQPILRSDAPGTDHVSELLDAVTSSTNGFTSVAHPSLSNYVTDWDYVDTTVDRVGEIYSRHGHYEEDPNGIQPALALGYRLGFVAVSDTRTAQPGDYGITAVLANSLSKSALHAAIAARRTYATTGAKILLQATLDGHAFGEEYTSSTGPTLSVTCTPPGTLESIEVLKNNVVVYRYPPSGGAPPPPATPWRRAPESTGPSWADPRVDDSGWSEARLDAELGRMHKAAGPLRLRKSVQFAGRPEGAIVRTNLTGEYRLWLNGRLLVDTRTFQYDDPYRPHDCNAPTAHELAGTPVRFRQLGFYDVGTLGGELRDGDNVLALETDSGPPPAEPPVLEIQPTTAGSPVGFSWADANFSGNAFYYLRVTQTDGEQAWSSPWWVNRMAPDTTPPKPPLKLRAHKDGNDVYLDWPRVTKDIAENLETMGFYRVFRGTTADFVPDRAGLANQIGTTTHSRYRDSNSLSGSTNYYYKIAAVDAAGNESTTNSNLAFKIHQPLSFNTGVSNIHWLSVPYEAVYSNADELARDLNRGSTGPFTKVVRWDRGTQRPLSWVYLGGKWSGSKFDLTPGEAVAVAIKQNCDAVLVGAHDEGMTTRLLANPGAPSLNWVAIPAHTPHQMAFQVVQDMNSGYFPTAVTRILRLRPDLQTYQIYQWSGGAWSGTNFVLTPGEAYGVEVQATTDWLPDTIAP